VARLRGSMSMRTRVARRKTSWGVGPATAATAGGNQTISSSSVVLATGGANPQTDGVTLVRTRGECTLYLPSASAAGDGYHGAFGIAKVSSAAFTASLSSRYPCPHRHRPS